jgi:diguanylate cyclase (GGDEF)-like protein
MGLAVAIGAVAIAYWALSSLVIRPVVRMRNMARRFGSGELDARIALNNQDEMGQLALALNSMAQQIQNYALSLERLVQERTSELANANHKLVEVNEHLEKLAITDPLTGLYNRRYFMEQLEFELQRGQRSGAHEFAVLLLDIDHFKHYNDTNGHTAGDELLQQFAILLEQNLRGTDIVARYGGEEFIVLLYDTGVQKGVVTAMKLQQLLSMHALPYEKTQPTGKLTVSIGVAYYPHDATDARALIDQADQALYRSKQNGRNRVTIWREVQRSQIA